MKFLFIALSLGFLLFGCADKKSATIEEEVLMKSFLSLMAGEVYDRLCQDSLVTKYNGTKDMNINLYGNTQLIVARIGGLQHLRFPDKSPEELVSKLLEIKKKVEEKTEQVLMAEGCDSDKARAASKSLQFYTEVPPWNVFALLNSQIEKLGGTVTSLDKNESVLVKDSVE